MNANESVVDLVRAAGVRQGWLAPGENGKILVALSGGGDSMAMLTALCEVCEDRIAAAHLEHGLRGDDSIADARFVAEHCKSIGIECFVRSVDVDAERSPAESSEMAGRRIRYAFFDEVASERGFSFIATGHTADDSIETMLYNFFRGTGLRGLVGITERRGMIVRPVIRCRRDQLREHLKDKGVRWCEDATNETGRYKRNLIRNELLPWVRRNLNGTPERALLDLASECASVNGRIEERATQICDQLRCSSTDRGQLASWDLKLARKCDGHDLLEAIRCEGRKLSLPALDRSRTELLRDLIRRSGRWRFQWAGDIEVVALNGKVNWTRRSDVEKLSEFS